MADDTQTDERPDATGSGGSPPGDSKSDAPDNGDGGSKTWLWVLIAVAAVAVVAGIWWFTSGQNVAVPDVVGGDQAAAQTALEDAGLKLGAVSQEASDEAPGTVITQDPAAGAQVPSGTEVAVVVSSGPEPVTVPDVKGKTKAEAEAALADAGLEATSAAQYDADVPKDVVMDQLPTAGEQVAAGSTVGFTVSLGVPTTTKVPDVTGQAADAAAKAVEEAGLVANASEVYDASVAPGNVVAQYPDAGVTADIGSDVLMAISLGPPDAGVTVPNTIGQSVGDAQNTLSSVGLTNRVVRDYSDQPKDAVVYQQPVGGAQAKQGARVDLLVSNGPRPANPKPPTQPTPPDGGPKPPPEIEIPTVDVPDVVGKTAEEAEKAVTEADLRPILIPFPSDEPEGQVIAQAPEAGSTVIQGFPVLMLVSSGSLEAVQLPSAGSGEQSE